MSGLNFNATDTLPFSNIFGQWSNGADETTNINTADFTAIPIFNTEETSNFTSEFVTNSTTEAQMVFDGRILVWANVGMQTSGTRVMIVARTYINSVGVGPLGTPSYIRNSGSGDSEGATVLLPTFHDVSIGDIVEIRTARVSTSTGSTVFYGTNQNYVNILRVS